ncbi:MAG: GNAT family N-acetyltransferase [Pseudomonadota bacterium]
MTVRHLDALFRAGSVLVLGEAQSAAQQQLLGNVESSLPAAQRPHLNKKPWLKSWPAAELCVVMQADLMSVDAVNALAAQGCKALLWAADAPPPLDVLQATRPHTLRVLGPRSAGLIYTGDAGHAARNFSSLPLLPKPGTVALIAQSQSVAAAALDWALGRGIGFSWLAVTGGEADVDVADLLDHAALDPHTRAVVLQVGHVRQARKFMSAARACARIKPVLVLQTRRANTLLVGGSDPIRSAAFRRAGLVECEALSGLFDGLAALELLPTVAGDRIAVVGNGSGVCALALDALLRLGLQPAVLSEATQQQIKARIPLARFGGAVTDLGSAAAREVVGALGSVLADAGVNVALLIHSPMPGQPHQPLATAVAEAAFGERLLTVWLGLHSAQPARQRSAAARMATFASADEAVRALRYRAQYRATRELLGQTPPPDAPLSIDVAAIRHRLQVQHADGLRQFTQTNAVSLLGQYGFCSAIAPEARKLPRIRVRAAFHAEIGMALSVATEPANPRLSPAYGLPPFDDLLARRLLEEAGCIGGSRGLASAAAMAAAVIRLGQLVLDQPLIEQLDVVLACADDGTPALLVLAEVGLRDTLLPERERVALSPYPAELTQAVTLHTGRRYTVRAVRPADEPAVLALLARLDPEEIRLRFFSVIRHFSHDMAARITQVDYDRELTLAAIADDAPDEIAALATLVADADAQHAEYAVLVQRSHARQGLGRHLLERLLHIAAARGVGSVHGDVLSDNEAMLGLVKSLGFAISTPPDDPGCRFVEISTRH